MFDKKFENPDTNKNQYSLFCNKKTIIDDIPSFNKFENYLKFI